MIARRGLMVGSTAALLTWSGLARAQTPDRTTLLAALMKLEKESWVFLKEKNIAAAAAYLADGALLIFGDGTLLTKDQYLKVIPDFRLDSFTIEPDADIRIWTTDVATLLYRITYASAMKDAKAVTLKVLSASTYVRRNDKWLSVLYQETRVP